MEDETPAAPRSAGNFVARIWGTPMGRLLLIGGGALAGFVLIQRFGQSVPAAPAVAPSTGTDATGSDGTSGSGVEMVFVNATPAPATNGAGQMGIPYNGFDPRAIKGPPVPGEPGYNPPGNPGPTRTLPPPRFLGPPVPAPGGPLRPYSTGLAAYNQWAQYEVVHPINGVAPSAETMHPLG